MIIHRFRVISRILLAGTLVLLGGVPLEAQQPAAKAAHPQSAARHSIDMTPVKPESVGFSSERLERLHALMQQAVDQKQIAGMVTILARHGKIVDYRAYGVRDLTTGAPMAKDTIFRDYSMTKPITGVAMMILYEQGKWLPSDPISKYIPEFAHLKVFNGVDADGNMILVEPDHPPTMRELMTHTAGFTYGIFGNTPVDAIYRNQHVLAAHNLQEMIDRLAKIPLLYQPGNAWTYSVSMDIQGYIVEKLSGQSLPDFMRDHIYAPLGMRDAGFYVPATKRDRFATLYETGPQDKLIPTVVGAGGMSDDLTPPTLPSGGGGMVSTAEDYYRFAQMLGNKGTLNGARVLAPASVHLMTTNHVPLNLLTGQYGIGQQILRPGFGYSYDGAVVFDPPEANLPEGKGTFFWDGLAGTWFWVDPANDVVFVGMIQRIHGKDPNVEYLSRSLVYQALLDPSK
jgi:CubicO group peptidase (beta-lactamase class C family)